MITLAHALIPIGQEPDILDGATYHILGSQRVLEWDDDF